MSVDNVHVKLIESTVKDVIGAEIKECEKFLGEGISGHLKDFVTGFRRGLVRASKQSELFGQSLFDVYGSLRAKEGKEYIRKKVRTQQVREIKGEIHAIASVISLIDEAIRSSTQIVEDGERIKRSLLHFIIREADLNSITE